MEVAKVAGAKALVKRAGTLRPSLARPRESDLGHRLGRSRGVDCYASVEDSVAPEGREGFELLCDLVENADDAEGLPKR